MPETLEKRIITAQEAKQAEKKEEEDLAGEKKSIIETIKIQVPHCAALLTPAFAALSSVWFLVGVPLTRFVALLVCRRSRRPLRRRPRAAAAAAAV